MSILHVDIAKDFSPILGPRHKADGPHSGEEFLETVLEPAFQKHDIVVFALDTVKIYSASFFEEAFGGLVRKHGLAPVEKKIRFSATERAYLIPKIETWMREAAEPERRAR
jgi:STAS-like domain of unknown function (DUF4325)